MLSKLDHPPAVGDLVGKGGFSKVYKGDLEGQAVAVKVMDKAWLKEKKLENRVREEMRIHGGLPQHPNVVSALGYFEDSQKIYLVLEFCARGNLYKFIRKNKPLEKETIVRWFREIVSAVAFLHESDIVHRDLKLSNILLTNDGQVKVSDFGLAAQIEDHEHHTICGTPNYMAPEVRNHDKRSGLPYNPVQADLWSLGCLLFALLHDGEHFDSKKKYKRTRMVKDDDAHNLLATLLSQDLNRSSAKEILRHPFLQENSPEQSPVIDQSRMSYVRLGIEKVRGVQHVFGSHLVQIQRDGTVVVSVIEKDTIREGGKRITVSEWMPDRYKKLQEYCAKAIEILKAATPKVVLKIASPEPIVAAVIQGVGRVWFQRRNLHATYNLMDGGEGNADDQMVVTIGDQKIRLYQTGANPPEWFCRLDDSKVKLESFVTRSSLVPGFASEMALYSLAETVQDLVLRCLDIEEDIHRSCPSEDGGLLYYPVIVQDEQVSIRGVGTGVRGLDGTVGLHLEDGTSLVLDQCGSTITCGSDSFALVRNQTNLHLPSIPPQLKRRLRKANTILAQLAKRSNS